MSQEKFQQAIQQIDQLNAEDPNTESYNGIDYPKELLYAQRMSEALDQFEPQAKESLKIAARAQHIARWKIDRQSYPMDRAGYLKWRTDLKKMHAELTASILEKVGYNTEFIKEVGDLIQKKLLKKNNDAQTLEDVVCLVFLNYYFVDFSEKHTQEKLIGIIQKTWAKMSEKGQASALALDLGTPTRALIEKALS
ncbi:DUF4202 domain-containing protein [Galbibacter sp.]|uniref:DUF4202 domain-containing protein n=1 Tax=Galbibacter sp. TaxID=2918471 RepID=UPI002C7F6228|nr:DUF4202 domain-containing protein [Galbibacter sp.]HLV61944.1 DUF4202 domain-containing protein [Galbibacter sp.]